MTMKKYGSPSALNIFRGEEVKVLDKHLQKTGKTAVSAFTEEELKALQEELDELNSEEEVDVTEEVKPTKKVRRKAVSESES